MRGDRLGQKMRGSSGRNLGRPSLCDKEPGKGPCLKQLHGPNTGVCRNCQAAEVQTVRLKIFGK